LKGKSTIFNKFCKEIHAFSKQIDEKSWSFKLRKTHAGKSSEYMTHQPGVCF